MMKNFNEMTLFWIRRFTDLLYHHAEENDKIALLLVNHENGDRKQLLIQKNEIERYLPYLRAKNFENYSVYMSVNVLRYNATERTKENFKTEQACIYLDFDAKNQPAHKMFKELFMEIGAGKLPHPSMIIKSSKGNYQLYWVFERVEPHDILRNIMQKLNAYFKLDYTHDIARVFRLPGFRNKKKGKDDLVQPIINDTLWIDKERGYKIKATYEKISNEWIQKIYEKYDVFERKDIVIEKEEIPASLKKIEKEKEEKLESLYKSFHQNTEKYKTKSERDIAFIIFCLCNKIASEEELKKFLLQKRSDKYDPNYYTNITIKKACAFIKQRKML